MDRLKLENLNNIIIGGWGFLIMVVFEGLGVKGMMDDVVSVEMMSVEVIDVDVGISIGWVGDGSVIWRWGVVGERGIE